MKTEAEMIFLTLFPQSVVIKYSNVYFNIQRAIGANLKARSANSLLQLFLKNLLLIKPSLSDLDE